MLLACLIILLAYLLLIFSFYMGFEKVEEFQLQDLDPVTKFSIVIPFRNEAQQLPALINSIKQLNYPGSKFELLFINDESTDDSVQLIKRGLGPEGKRIDFQILDNQRSSGSPKKDAIKLGVQKAQYRYIVTTDADVQLPIYWLDSFDECIQKQAPDLIVAPVQLTGTRGFLHRFQRIDFLSLQGTTIGAFGIKNPIMCNAANLCYRRETFTELSGFKDNDHLASGDDVFLLERMIRHEKEVLYLKSNKVIVKTSALDSLVALIEQRQRWSAKARSYNLRFAKLTGFIVLFANIMILCLPLMWAFQLISLKSLILIFFVKLSIDFLLLYKTSRWFNDTEVLISFLSSSLLYPVFSTFVFMKSLFGSYQWKGRVFKA